MRYTVSVLHTSEHNLDNVWHELGKYDDAAMALYEYLKFQQFYGRPCRIEDAQFRVKKGNNHAVQQ